MNRIICFILFAGITITANAQRQMLLDSEFVDLKGKPATTVFVNNTPDTLQLRHVFFNWLPYKELTGTLDIPPGRSDSITRIYNFPDFIYINGRFNVYNSPGNRLVCNVNEYNVKSLSIDFDGQLGEPNLYYLKYHQHIGGYLNESRPYYTLGEQLEVWDSFAAKADSINQKSLSFLAEYKAPLPAWFKKHERERLMYNLYTRLYNVLISKEYKTGKKILVNKSYYDFEKYINTQTDMIVSDAYVYCMDMYFGHKAKTYQYTGYEGRLKTINDLYGKTDIGDFCSMFSLGRLYTIDKKIYPGWLEKIEFKQAERKLWIDSAIQSNLGVPYLGKKAPILSLTDISGKPVLLSSYLGKPVIINFWATWCAPCIAEFPVENEISEKYKDKGITVINICVDSDKETWLRYTKKHDLKMVNLYTSKKDFFSIQNKYNLSSLPRSILLDKTGNVADNYFKRASLLTDDELMMIALR